MAKPKQSPKGTQGVRTKGKNLTYTTSRGASLMSQKSRMRTNDEIAEFKTEYSIDDHMITLEELEIRYKTSIKNGLGRDYADEVLLKVGPNCLVAPPGKSRWILLADFIFCGFNALLWCAAVMSFVDYGIRLSKGKPDAQDQLCFGMQESPKYEICPEKAWK